MQKRIRPVMSKVLIQQAKWQFFSAHFWRIDRSFWTFEREGITDITAEDIAAAKKSNCRWKLIGSVKKADHKVITSVKPEMIPIENPLANVTGATNAIQYETDLLGPGSF